MFNSDTAVALCTHDGGYGGEEGVIVMMERKALTVTRHRVEDKLLTLLSDILSPAQQRLFNRDLDQTVTRSGEANRMRLVHTRVPSICIPTERMVLPGWPISQIKQKSGNTHIGK